MESLVLSALDRMLLRHAIVLADNGMVNGGVNLIN